MLMLDETKREGNRSIQSDHLSCSGSMMIKEGMVSYEWCICMIREDSVIVMVYHKDGWKRVWWVCMDDWDGGKREGISYMYTRYIEWSVVN